MEMDNAREFSRIEMPVRVEVIAEEYSIVSETRDISMNGILVCADQLLPAGSLCAIHITLGDTEEESCVIEAHGKVARSSEQGMAIQFVDIEVDGFSHLKKLVMFNASDTKKVEHEFSEHAGIRHE